MAGRHILCFPSTWLAKHRRMSDRFGGIAGTTWSAPSTCRRRLRGANSYPPGQDRPPAEPANSIPRKWNASSLAVSQYVFEAPVPGVTPFGDSSRPEKLNMQTDKSTCTQLRAQHAPRTLHSNTASDRITMISWSNLHLESLGF